MFSLMAQAASLSLLVPATVQADSKMVVKAELQAAMQAYIDERLNKGHFLYTDEQSGEMLRLRPLGAHPMILRTDTYFILCTDFRTDGGEKVNVDFFITRTDHGYLTFQHSVEEREIVRNWLKKGVAEKYN